MMTNEPYLTINDIYVEKGQSSLTRSKVVEDDDTVDNSVATTNTSEINKIIPTTDAKQIFGFLFVMIILLWVFNIG